MRALRVASWLAPLALVLPAAEADAQFYRERGRTVEVRAPFVRVLVQPNGVVVGAPGVRVNTMRPYLDGPPVAVPPVAVPPVVAGSPTEAPGLSAAPLFVPNASPSPSPAVSGGPAPPFLGDPASGVVVPAKADPALSPAELSALTAPDLLAELANRSNELDAALGLLPGGEGWQRYLALPEGVATGDADPELLGRLLSRFESVERGPQFARVSRLRAFRQTKRALAAAAEAIGVASEAAASVGEPAPQAEPAPAAVIEGPLLGAPSAQPETLPTPSADAPGAERSVLKP